MKTIRKTWVDEQFNLVPPHSTRIKPFFEAAVFVTALVVMSALAFTGCMVSDDNPIVDTSQGTGTGGSGGGGGGGKIDPPSGPAAKIPDYDLTWYIPEPFDGATPVTGFKTPYHSGQVEWTSNDGMAADDTFRVGETYIATVILTMPDGTTPYKKHGYDYFKHNGADADKEAKFTAQGDGAEQSIETNDGANPYYDYKEDVTTIKIRFKETQGGDLKDVTEYDLTQYIAKPKIKKTPQVFVSAYVDDEYQYRGTIEWTPTAQSFEKGKNYTAKVRLTAAPGWEFNSSTFKYAGADVSTPDFKTPKPVVEFYIRNFGKMAVPAKYFSAKPDDPDDTDDGVINLIMAAAEEEHLVLELPMKEESEKLEKVEFGNRMLPGGGLLLTESTSPANITIHGSGQVIDLTGHPTGAPLITVNSGVTLTLQDITIKGLMNDEDEDGTEADNNAPLIKVLGGKLILDGAKLIANRNDGTNNDGANNLGGCVSLVSGEIEMIGISEISNNHAVGDNGGGVYIADGKFTMKGDSTIHGNTAKYGGGVYIVYMQNGMFAMEGGEIYANTATTGGGGVYVGNDGTFKKTGGIIYGSNDADKKNSTENNNGNAVLTGKDKKYNTTAGSNVDLDSEDTDGWD